MTLADRLGRYAATLVKGLFVTALVAGVVVLAVTVVVPPLTADPPEEQEIPEFSPDRVVSEPLPAEGSIEPQGSAEIADPNGIIVIDAGHSNRFSRPDVAPLVEAFARLDYEIRFHRSGPLDESLRDADGLIVIDPASRYTTEELDAMEEFETNGGRIAVFGEPTRIAVQAGLFGATLTEQQSQLTGIEARFGVQFDTRFVYDQDRNDGTYKNVLVGPTDDAALPPRNDAGLGEVADVAMYTATEVRSTDDDAQPVLVTGSGARIDNGDGAEVRTVAVRNDGVLAVGDSTFLTAGRHNVADNEEFLAYVVEFLAAGDHTPPTVEVIGADGGDGETGNGGDAGTDGTGTG